MHTTEEKVLGFEKARLGTLPPPRLAPPRRAAPRGVSRAGCSPDPE